MKPTQSVMAPVHDEDGRVGVQEGRQGAFRWLKQHQGEGERQPQAWCSSSSARPSPSPGPAPLTRTTPPLASPYSPFLRTRPYFGLQPIHELLQAARAVLLHCSTGPAPPHSRDLALGTGQLVMPHRTSLLPTTCVQAADAKPRSSSYAWPSGVQACRVQRARLPLVAPHYHQRANYQVSRPWGGVNSIACQLHL